MSYENYSVKLLTLNTFGAEKKKNIWKYFVHHKELVASKQTIIAARRSTIAVCLLKYSIHTELASRAWAAGLASALVGVACRIMSTHFAVSTFWATDSYTADDSHIAT